MKFIRPLCVMALILTGNVFAETKSTTIQEKETLVQVAKVEQRALAPKTMIVGSVQARHYGELSAGIQGKLQWIQEAGSHVKRGDIIAKLDNRRLLLQQAEQQANIEYETVLLNREQANYKRVSQLTSSISKAELDQIRSERDLAITKLKLAEIKLALIQDELAKTAIHAPFNGIITERQHQVGEDVTPASPILSILDPQQLEIRLYAPLKYHHRVKVNEQLQVFHSHGSFMAPIRHLIPVSSNNSQTFEARISIPNAQLPHVNIGEIVSLEMPIAPKSLSTLVPRDALILRADGHYVFKITANKLAEKVAVDIGEGDGDWIAVKSIITGALQDKDLVVTRGAETLKAAQRVKFDIDKSIVKSAS